MCGTPDRGRPQKTLYSIHTTPQTRAFGAATRPATRSTRSVAARATKKAAAPKVSAPRCACLCGRDDSPCVCAVCDVLSPHQPVESRLNTKIPINHTLGGEEGGQRPGGPAQVSARGGSGGGGERASERARAELRARATHKDSIVCQLMPPAPEGQKAGRDAGGEASSCRH